MKRKPKRKRKRKEITYTRIDSMGIRWRMVGGCPVSELADKVMRDCGLPLR